MQIKTNSKSGRKKSGLSSYSNFTIRRQDKPRRGPAKPMPGSEQFRRRRYIENRTAQKELDNELLDTWEQEGSRHEAH